MLNNGHAGLMKRALQIFDVQVEDRGGAIKGEHRIDLYHRSHRNALQWGRRKVQVFSDLLLSIPKWEFRNFFMLRSCLNTKYLINICDDHHELNKVIYHVAKLEVLCLLVAKKAVQRDEVTTLQFLEQFEVSAPYLQKLGWNIVDHLLCYFV